MRVVNVYQPRHDAGASYHIPHDPRSDTWHGGKRQQEQHIVQYGDSIEDGAGAEPGTPFTDETARKLGHDLRNERRRTYRIEPRMT